MVGLLRGLELRRQALRRRLLRGLGVSDDSYHCIAVVWFFFALPAILVAVPMIIGGGPIVAPGYLVVAVVPIGLAAFGLLLCLSLIAAPVGLLLL